MTENNAMENEMVENEMANVAEENEILSLNDLGVDAVADVEDVVEKAQAILPEGAIVAAQIKTSDKKETIEKLVKRPHTVNFKLAIQRNDVWDDNRRSKLIESYALGYPVPAVYSVKADNQDWMLDGKQRLTTIFRFLGVVDNEGNIAQKENFGNGFRLQGVATHIVIQNDVGEVEGVYPFNGLTFNELDPVVKSEILSAQVYFVRADSLTDAQKDEIFLRLNNGMPLVNMELTRAIAGSIVMSLVEEISASTFFSTSVSLSDDNRNRFIDNELVTQIMMLVEDWHTLGADSFFKAQETIVNGKKQDNSKNRGFDGKAIVAAVTNWKEHGYNPDLLVKLNTAVEYLGNALPDNQKFLKKTHAPSVVIAAMQAIEDGIPAVKFGGWVQEFFARLKKESGTAYATASRAGAAKPNNVRIRVVEMMKAYHASIASASDYVAPVATQNKRGRKTRSQIAGEPVVVTGEGQTGNPEGVKPEGSENNEAQKDEQVA